MNCGILKSENNDHTLPCHKIILETPIISVIVIHCTFERTISLSFSQIQPITYVIRDSIKVTKMEESQTYKVKALESKIHRYVLS